MNLQFLEKNCRLVKTQWTHYFIWTSKFYNFLTQKSLDKIIKLNRINVTYQFIYLALLYKKQKKYIIKRSVDYIFYKIVNEPNAKNEKITQTIWSSSKSVTKLGSLWQLQLLIRNEMRLKYRRA